MNADGVWSLKNNRPKKPKPLCVIQRKPMSYKQPYAPPKLEAYQYSLTTGFSFPVGSDALEPLNDFLETPTEEQ
jgi:hypothetical protein